VAARVAPQRAVALGCTILALGMAILVAALQFSSLAGLIVAALVSGIGQGLSFSRGLAAVAERTPAQRLAEVSSTYFVVAYIAISLPVISEGFAARWGFAPAASCSRPAGGTGSGLPGRDPVAGISSGARIRFG